MRLVVEERRCKKELTRVLSFCLAVCRNRDLEGRLGAISFPRIKVCSTSCCRRHGLLVREELDTTSRRCLLVMSSFFTSHCEASHDVFKPHSPI